MQAAAFERGLCACLQTKTAESCIVCTCELTETCAHLQIIGRQHLHFGAGYDAPDYGAPAALLGTLLLVRFRKRTSIILPFARLALIRVVGRV